MTAQRVVGATGDDELGQLRREEALELRQPSDVRDLLRDSLLKRGGPFGKLAALRLDEVAEQHDVVRGVVDDEDSCRACMVLPRLRLCRCAAPRRGVIRALGRPGGTHGVVAPGTRANTSRMDATSSTMSIGLL